MNDKTNLKLVGDVGGTNARFALVDEKHQPHSAKTYVAAEYATMADALQQYINDVSIPNPSSVAIAVATRVLGDDVAFTNNEDWSFSIPALKQELGVARLHIVNDFAALALSVPHLAADQLQQVGPGKVLANEPIGVVGPGTGLGVSGLIPLDKVGKQWHALKSEGGHASASPVTEREIALLGVLAKRFGHVSFERFLSGPGLVNTYSGLCELDGNNPQPYSPADVTEKGLAGTDLHCREALEIFCAMLGTAAANLAVTLGTFGGIYIGGGIVPRLGAFFNDSTFRSRFESKGRVSDELLPIPTIVIHDPYPGLLGAAQLLA